MNGLFLVISAYLAVIVAIFFILLNTKNKTNSYSFIEMFFYCFIYCLNITQFTVYFDVLTSLIIYWLLKWSVDKKGPPQWRTYS